MKDNRDEQIKPNTDKQPKRGRDPRGVKINNYKDAYNGRQPVQNPEAEAPNILIETMRRGINQEIATESGAIVEGKRGRGQPPKYPTVEGFLDKVNEYLQYIVDTYNNTGYELIPDVEGLASFMGICRDTLNEWEKSRSPEYSAAIKQVKTAIMSYKKQLAMKGKIPAVVFAIDANNNHGYVQQNRLEINTTAHLQELPTPEDIARRLPSGD